LLQVSGNRVNAAIIRVRGLVQGVGFRPTVWRLARDNGLVGDVRNDGEGVLVRLRGDAEAIERFCRELAAGAPPLARIDAIERGPGDGLPGFSGFEIVASDHGDVHTGVVADAATCAACVAEIRDPADRRYRYPFTNCTHCGPRLSIIRGIPYDRANTSMAPFTQCPQCAAEYTDPADRRFHAQPNACPVCGPRAWLIDAEGGPVDAAASDAVALASARLARGDIVAIKGIGGFHLACDACNPDSVAELRRRKRRYGKPFALMARDLDVIGRYAEVGPAAADALTSPAAPILLLPAVANGVARAADAGLAPLVAPGQATLGFMLPYSPLHHLLLQDWDRPLVMTSGNLSDEPQCTDNADARSRLLGLADCALLHDREIVNRVDDSVVRIMAGQPRLLRRARGHAPSAIRLADGFSGRSPVLALGGELKNTICLLRDGEAIVSQHLGDLEDARTAAEFERAVALYQDLFACRPRRIAIDLHPDYRSSRFGQALAGGTGLAVIEVQHHFAHIASVLAENGWPTDGSAVIGIALDGLGLGSDGTIWGGEFLLADYRRFERLAHLAPVPMPGGTRAILEPWRNTYAQLARAPGWERVRARYPDLGLTADLAARPLQTLDAMCARGLNSPLSSSCGRLFDAVAAAVGVAPERIDYEGQAAIALEALALRARDTPGEGYPFRLQEAAVPWQLDPAPMWDALLGDLQHGVAPADIAARFHAGLARAVAGLAARLAGRHAIDTVALSGGVLQNRVLFEAVVHALTASGLRVLTHRLVPANDGGLSLGQAAIAALATD
jgi:hydrogenase maturation protein HypF